MDDPDDATLADFKTRLENMLVDVRNVDEQKHVALCESFCRIVEGHTVPEVLHLVWWITHMLEQEGAPWSLTVAVLAAMHNPTAGGVLLMRRPAKSEDQVH